MTLVDMSPGSVGSEVVEPEDFECAMLVKRFTVYTKNCYSWTWWHTLVIPVIGRLRQEDRRFAASLSYLVRPCFKK